MSFYPRENKPWVSLLGRALIALLFIASGLGSIPAWQPGLEGLRAQGLIYPALFLFPAIFVQVIAGSLLLIGYKARISSLALIAYVIVSTLIFHDFWSFSGGMRQIHLVSFMMNLAIIGGLLQIATFGAGTLSVDTKLERRRLTRQGPSIRLAS